MPMNKIHSRRRTRGISMVEALVALVIISVGMLGIAGLYLSSLQAGRSANLRMQAVNLASDLGDRIRANKRGVASYQASATTTGKSNDCATKTCTAVEIAENDLFIWKQGITTALPANANGQVTYTAATATTPSRCTIMVVWREAGADADSTYSLTVEV
jgi:type IV pilus assembly protein PilV